MNYLIFILKTALEDFRRNKIRTFLTSLGILVGVMSVVLLIAVSLGLRTFIQGQFESLGTNLLFVIPAGALRAGSFSNSGIQFDETDLRRISRIPTTEYVIPARIFQVTASYKGQEEDASIYISNEDVFPARNLELEVGETFKKSDVDKRSKVAVIGSKLALKLFDEPVDALNKTIKASGQNLKIIGVTKPKGVGGFGAPDWDSFIFIPYKAGFLFINQDKKFNIIVKVADENTIPQVKQDIITELSKRYDEDKFEVLEQTEIINTIGSILGVFNIVLIAIAAISLLVGGIGIMNIMYVTVTERIKEIGVRRALGATQKDILIQFLAEAILLSLLGGILGLIIAVLVVFAIQRLFPAYINIASVGIALGVSSFIGIVFGVFPAKKAADLSPIEAIRYE